MLAAVGGYAHLHTTGARAGHGEGPGPPQVSESTSLQGEMSPYRLGLES